MPLIDNIDIDTHDARILRIRIPNNWQSHATVTELETALNHTLTAALPPPMTHQAGEDLPVRSDISSREFTECMQMHQAWHDALDDFRRRERAGEFTDNHPNEVIDERQRLSITFRDGRFEALHLRPDWAEKATAQKICDAILDATQDLDLVRPDPRTQALQHVRDLDAEIRRYTH